MNLLKTIKAARHAVKIAQEMKYPCPNDKCTNKYNSDSTYNFLNNSYDCKSCGVLTRPYQKKTASWFTPKYPTNCRTCSYKGQGHHGDDCQRGGCNGNVVAIDSKNIPKKEKKKDNSFVGTFNRNRKKNPSFN